MMSRPTLLVLAGALVTQTLVVSNARAQLQPHFERVIMEGDTAPGTAGAEFCDFGVPSAQYPIVVLDGAGAVSFFTRLELQAGLVDGSNDVGLWRWKDATTTLLAREGSTAPGTNGAIFGGFDLPPLEFFDETRPEWIDANDADDIVFGGMLRVGIHGVTTDNDSGIWLRNDTSFELVVREGDEAPGSNGALFTGFGQRPILNNAGDVLFRANVTGDFEGLPLTGLWLCRDGEIIPVAKPGDPVPGMPGAVFRTFERDNELPAINDVRQVVFGGSIEQQNGQVAGGLWVLDLVAHTTTPVALNGQAVPGPQSGEFFRFRGPQLTNTGAIAFWAQFETPTGDPFGLWQLKAGVLSTIVTSDVPIALTGGQSSALAASSDFVMTEDESVIFHALFPPDDPLGGRGLWCYQAGTIRELVRSGAGVTSNPAEAFDNVGPGNKVVADSNGNVLFNANETGESTSDLWQSTAGIGALVLEVESGNDPIDIDPTSGSETLRMPSLVDIERDQLRGGGRLASTIHFTDDSAGVFMISLAGACPGDADRSRRTDVADISFVVSNLGRGSLGDFRTLGDVDGDGLVSVSDITFVVSNLGCGGL